MAFRDSINDLMFRFYERFKQNNNRLPVSVDADINVGDVQIGTVKQGGVDEGAEPWKVKAEELEQKIDALKQSIESGVQLKGQIVELGRVAVPVQIPPRGIYEIVPRGLHGVFREVRASFYCGANWQGNYTLRLRILQHHSNLNKESAFAVLAQVDNFFSGSGRTMEITSPRWCLELVNNNDFEARLTTAIAYGVM